MCAVNELQSLLHTRDRRPLGDGGRAVSLSGSFFLPRPRGSPGRSGEERTGPGACAVPGLLHQHMRITHEMRGARRMGAVFGRKKIVLRI